MVIKSDMLNTDMVAPVRERGLKYQKGTVQGKLQPVAPVRERGLKFGYITTAASSRCRSREEAWIEIASMTSPLGVHMCRSREGAWIEMRQRPTY